MTEQTGDSGEDDDDDGAEAKRRSKNVGVEEERTTGEIYESGEIHGGENGKR
jgi:hypothetical protein